MKFIDTKGFEYFIELLKTEIQKIFLYNNDKDIIYENISNLLDRLVKNLKKMNNVS